MLAGPSRSAYGLVCAAQGGDPYYEFLIDGESDFAVFRSDRERLLRDWSSDVFGIDRRQNHLAAECRAAENGDGTKLSFWVNATRVAEVTDPHGAMPSFFGVVVLGDRPGPVQVRFDNLRFQPFTSVDAEPIWWQLQRVSR